MQRFRRPVHARLVAVLALTLCAGFALSGCRSQPGVAAYVGDERLYESQIDETINTVKATKDAKVPTRSQIVQAFVLSRSCEALRAEKGFDTVPVSDEEIASQLSVPASTQYAQDYVKFASCAGGYKADTSTPPTDAEIRVVYDRALAGGLIQPGTPFEEIRDAIAADQTVAQGLQQQRTFAPMLQAGDISVNPRYRPLELVLASLPNESGPVTLISVPMGEPASEAVKDLPASPSLPLPQS